MTLGDYSGANRSVWPDDHPRTHLAARERIRMVECRRYERVGM